MKTVSEFANFNLTAGQKAKAALTGEGKSPEEIETSLGTTFKMEGNRLKYFIAAMDVAQANAENLKRILVVSLAEGEKEPAKATKVDEVYLIPEFHVDPKKNQAAKDAKGGRGGGRGGRGGKGGGRDGGGKKESPWGLSPEEKAAKNKGGGGNKPQ